MSKDKREAERAARRAKRLAEKPVVRIGVADAPEDRAVRISIETVSARRFVASVPVLRIILAGPCGKSESTQFSACCLFHLW